ncbi:YciI family protein [Rhizobium sp. XQZ8]|uniref:YciI family protein n=1 Tax=Rhizobium populisoli TaxID=2859785 RepID=UPI001C6821B0|nr:YciI family protein [Rhizobium populisoli]MBW6423126.1 YciI family protein [Rhizobium populisoli]
MLYAILCYAHEETVFAWSKDEEDAVMAKLLEVQAPYAKAGKLGPVGRLMPTTAATTVRKGKDEALVIDGPFAETKEVLLGFYTAEFDTLDEAVTFSKELSAVNPGSSSYEIRPFYVFHPGDMKNSESKT